MSDPTTSGSYKEWFNAPALPIDVIQGKRKAPVITGPGGQKKVGTAPSFAHTQPLVDDPRPGRGNADI